MARSGLRRTASFLGALGFVWMGTAAQAANAPPEEVFSATEQNGGPALMRGAPILIDPAGRVGPAQRLKTEKKAPKGWNSAQEKALKKRPRKASSRKEKKVPAAAATTRGRSAPKGGRLSRRIEELERELSHTREQLVRTERELEGIRKTSFLSEPRSARGRRRRLDPPAELLACIQPGKGNYDMVRADQADSIAGRLALVELLIVKFNRAYDYRIHTTRELETILAELERHGDALPPPPPVR